MGQGHSLDVPSAVIEPGLGDTGLATLVCAQGLRARLMLNALPPGSSQYPWGISSLPFVTEKHLSSVDPSTRLG